MECLWLALIHLLQEDQIHSMSSSVSIMNTLKQNVLSQWLGTQVIWPQVSQNSCSQIWWDIILVLETRSDLGLLSNVVANFYILTKFKRNVFSLLSLPSLLFFLFLLSFLCVCVCVCEYIYKYICIYTHISHRVSQRDMWFISL